MGSREKWFGGAITLTYTKDAIIELQHYTVVGIDQSDGTAVMSLPLPGDPEFDGYGAPFTDGRVVYIHVLNVALNIDGVAVATDEVAKCTWIAHNDAWQIEVRSRTGCVGILDAVPALFALGAATLNKFDPTLPAWVAGTACPRSHNFGAAAKIANRGYFVGYYALTATHSEKNDELSDGGGGTLGTWTVRTDSPVQMGRNVAASAGKYAYFLKGDGGQSNYRWSRMPLAWTAMTDTPIHKSRGSASGLGTKVVVVSGDPVPVPNLSYWTAADAYWSVGNTVGGFRYSHSTFSLRGKSYTAGGKTDTPAYFTAVDIYDPILETFSAGTALGVATYGAQGFSSPRLGYLCGGRNSAGTSLATAQSYNGSTWTSIGTMVAAVADGGSLGVAI